MQLDYRDYPVLFVDDEPQNLVTFRYALEEQFSLLTSSSGEEALSLLAQNDVAVLVTDQRMPGITGVDVCARAQEIRPDTARIIITAYADLHAVVDAINRGQVSRYMVKPWRNEELAEVLRTAIEFVHIQRAMQDMEVRLLRVGQARGAIAAQDKLLHEISNPLSAMMMTASQVAQSVEQTQQALANGDIEQATRRLLEMQETQADTITSLEQLDALCRRFRRGNGERDRGLAPSCEAARVVDATARILRRDIERTARLSVVLQGNPRVAMAPSELGQIVLNLLLNAAQALEDGRIKDGMITVELSTEGEVARLRVRDTGPGIAAADREQVFQPYFTTRPSGTGLGLAIVHDLVTNAGGTIAVQSERGDGCCFELTLPRV